jgi:tRNA uridine 5-carboxymethylaminomethyl modification enzyme
LIKYKKRYDVIIVGAGHAGCEAALAAGRLGCRTLLLTMNLDTIALMSCNPAIGGPAKSHLVREIDALGGEMGKAADATFLQMKMLNMSKGPAVRSLRAQSDKAAYHSYMKNMLENQVNLDIKQAIVTDIIMEKRKIKGVKTKLGVHYQGKTVIITTGTFLKGMIHVGMQHMPSGRMGEFPSVELSDSLARLGLKLGRLKTGTTPRLDGRTIAFSRMIKEPGSPEPYRFSFYPKEYFPEQLPCYITHTNTKTHKLIRNNLDRSPLYQGKIQGIGPRYCPSIEDKVVRFPDKERHLSFIEPEGRNTREMYTQGMSTSLPEDIQIRFLRTMPGLENVEIMRPGYAVEYDFVYPSQVERTLETKKIKGLFLAGQVNGTSGYEEAAAQGIVAGMNAALKVQDKEQVIFGRENSYIGTLIDDLVTKEITEPYRMMTSRSEYRLLLRQDNADLRLTDIGHKIGLITNERYKLFLAKKNKIQEEIKRLKHAKVVPNPKNMAILELLKEPLRKVTTLAELLCRKNLDYEKIKAVDETQSELPKEIVEQVEIELKYEGYIERQYKQVAEFKKLENKRLLKGIDYCKIKGLRKEAREKLQRIQPISIGQAGRVAGINPADISVLMVYLAAIGRGKGRNVSRETNPLHLTKSRTGSKTTAVLAKARTRNR